MVTDEAFNARQRVWNDVLDRINDKAEVITGQLDHVREHEPELVAAFQLLLAYVGHLHSQLGGMLPPTVGLPRLPAGFCERNRFICDCANGSTSACKVLGPAEVELEGPTVPMCEELWQRYLEALQRERTALLEAIQHGRPTAVPEDRVLQPITESERLLREFRARKCLEPVSMATA
jgi:hypothetical protein